jgi:hypothetical protein
LPVQPWERREYIPSRQWLKLKMKSARRNGNSSTLCDEFLHGAKEAGHETEKIFLCDKTAYLIAAGQAPEERYMTTMIDGFRKYIGCFPNIREGGIVLGYGVSGVGDIKAIRPWRRLTK